MTFRNVGLVLVMLFVSLSVDAQEPKKKTEIVVPGSVQAFESVALYGRVSGYVKQLSVDIGDLVRKGQVLAVLDAPELEVQVKRDQAGVVQAQARVARAKSAVRTAQADLEALKAMVKQAEANVEGKAALARVREREHKRLRELVAKGTVSVAEVADGGDRFEAARADERAAQAAVLTARAQLVGGMSRLEQAEVEIQVLEADVEVARTQLDRSKVFAGLAVITAPFDGVIVERNFFVGDFVRTDQAAKPLLTVERRDLMRLVVQVAEQDAPFIDRGNDATIEIHAFPGKQWTAKVSRIAMAEDLSRTMRVELDLPNPTGRVYSGMTSTVTIKLNTK